MFEYTYTVFFFSLSLPVFQFSTRGEMENNISKCGSFRRECNFSVRFRYSYPSLLFVAAVVYPGPSFFIFLSLRFVEFEDYICLRDLMKCEGGKKSVG